MMVEEGYGNRDPRVRLAELQLELQRECRAIVALRRAHGRTCRSPTRRGSSSTTRTSVKTPPGERRCGRSHDPMDGVYFLGKLEILKLRDDYRNKGRRRRTVLAARLPRRSARARRSAGRDRPPATARRRATTPASSIRHPTHAVFERVGAPQEILRGGAPMQSGPRSERRMQDLILDPASAENGYRQLTGTSPQAVPGVARNHDGHSADPAPGSSNMPCAITPHARDRLEARGRLAPPFDVRGVRRARRASSRTRSWNWV